MLMAGLSAMSPVTMIGAAATAGQEKASVKVTGLVVDKYGEPVRESALSSRTPSKV